MRTKLAVAFLLGFLILSIASAQISVESMTGTYQVKRSVETEFSDSTTNYLEQGDSLRTITDSSVNISFLDGSYIIFGPETEGTFNEILGDPESGLFVPFEITNGVLRVNKQNNGSLVSVMTPHVIVNVDSDLVFEISNEETIVYVIEGSANILELNLSPIFEVDQGNMLIVGGGSITSPYPYDESELNQVIAQFNQNPFFLPVGDSTNPLFYVVLIVVVVCLILVVYKLTRKKSIY